MHKELLFLTEDQRVHLTAFSRLKAILRRVGARTREALQEALMQALPGITAPDALGWFLHWGYPAPETTERA